MAIIEKQARLKVLKSLRRHIWYVVGAFINSSIPFISFYFFLLLLLNHHTHL